MMRFAASLLLGAVFGLGGCSPGEGSAPRAKQSVAHWAQKRLMFVGDTRNGIVHILLARDGVTQVGYFKPHGRRAVLGIRVDAAQGRVWVLDRDAAYVHDFDSRRLLARYPAPAGLALEGFADDAPEPLIVAGGLRLRPEGAVLVLVAQQAPGPQRGKRLPHASSQPS